PLSISDFFLSSRRRHTRSKRDWSSDVCSSDLLFALTLCNGKEISPEHLGLSSHTPALMQPTLPLRPPEQPLADFLEDIERQEILATLESTMWNRTAAAKRLGMSVRSLRYRLEKLAIEAPEEA